MKAELNSGVAGPVAALPADVAPQVRAALHELATVFTGLLVTSGLLRSTLETGKALEYADGICELGERGATLVRELRRMLPQESGME